MALNYGLLNPTHSISKGLLKFSKTMLSFVAFGGWYGVITG
jgi:hypothetical protein